MDKEIKAEWSRRLRSGDYRQGKGNLSYSSGGKEWYCCLGVLCEIAVERGICQRIGNALKHFGHERNWRSNYLPDEVAEWASITHYYQETLAVKNDEGDSFRLIANYIDQHV